MSDNLKLKQRKETTKVNIKESWEQEFWSKELGISTAQLRIVVSKVGSTLADIERYLKWK